MEPKTVKRMENHHEHYLPLGGILSGTEIHKQILEGNIVVEPFDKNLLGPNSLDVRLGQDLIELDSHEVGLDNEWDLTRPIPEHDVLKYSIPAHGKVLEKGVAYLAHTIEKIWCRNFVPWLDTRSTVGRFFLMCHMTAGRGDIQWEGTYTMEMMAMARSIRVYAGLPVAQVSFFSVQGAIVPYQGNYSGQTGPRLPNPLKLGAVSRGKDHKE